MSARSQTRSQTSQSRAPLVPKEVALLQLPKDSIERQARARRIEPARARRIEAIRREVETRTTALAQHRYFDLCREKQIGRVQVMGIIQQLYCFSVFFERLLTLRIARYTSQMDARVLVIARKHLREEFGHADLFRRCLIENGMPVEQVIKIQPKMFTRALYGYLTAIINHENEFVGNVAIMQAMESLGYQFFSATLPVLQHHKMMSTAMQAHSEDDEAHSQLGIEFAEHFDDDTLRMSLATISDLYRLMGYVLDEWLADR
jgi:hypothetical protein